MSVFAINGAAGCGKTFTLMEKVKSAIADEPLKVHERILALTFMHGSRRRLSEKLSTIASLKRRFDCQTIDSFALKIITRWATLARQIGLVAPAEDDYTLLCNNAAILLRQPYVRAWIINSFPIIIIDEAQDLSEVRLAMLDALKGAASLFIAADEFQCLDERLVPNPLFSWLPKNCIPEILTEPKRTNAAELLAAARELRNGQALTINAGSFKVFAVQSKFVAAAFVANAIAWGGTRNVAIITPHAESSFVNETIDLVTQRRNGKQNNGPYSIMWEKTDKGNIEHLLTQFAENRIYRANEVITILNKHSSDILANVVVKAIDKKFWVSGIDEFSFEDLKATLIRKAALQRQFGISRYEGYLAMNVHQAKNREFDNVIIIWPYTAGGNEENKRRVLYNAITRAKTRCTLLIQSRGKVLSKNTLFGI